MQLTVRRATLDDVDALARINIDTWRSAYTGIVPQPRIDGMDLAAYRARWINNVTTGRPGVAFFVAELDGVPAAYSIGGPYRPQEEAGPEVTDHLGELYGNMSSRPAGSRPRQCAAHRSVGVAGGRGVHRGRTVGAGSEPAEPEMVRRPRLARRRRDGSLGG